MQRNANRTTRIRKPTARQSPLQRIATLTNATKIPQLNPIQEAPWQTPLNKHPRVTTILPPPKQQREEYENEIKQLLTNLPNNRDTLVISTDGSRRRVNTRQLQGNTPQPPQQQYNPLPTRRRIRGPKRTGAGVNAKVGDTTVFERSYGVGRRTNVYDGETFALLAGMLLAADYCKGNENIKNILFLSDSASALDNITSVKAHPTQPFSILFSKHAQDFLLTENHKIKLQWIPGHHGHEINERADKLAKRGCKRQHEFLNKSIAYYNEKRSKLVLSKWRDQLKKEPLTGAIGEVTYYPPTTKPNKLFLQLQERPEVFGRLTQIRTMHGYNPSYYARFNIPQELDCICGHEIPPEPMSRYRDHILHNCDAYLEHRRILTAVNRDHSPNILLGSNKGLFAIAKFLQLSGAFTSTGRPYEAPTAPQLPDLDLRDLTPDEPYHPP